MKVIAGLILGSVIVHTHFARSEDNFGANEKATAECCKAFAEAEEIFRRTDYDADGVLEYAQALRGGPAPAPEADPKALPQPTEDEAKTIKDLIAKMKSDEFNVREKASNDLKAMDVKPYAILKETLKTEKDPEIVARCRNLIKAIEIKLSPASPVPAACNLFERTPNTGNLALIDKELAMAECYKGVDPAKVTPKNGYLFRVLTRQGESATGGKRSYIVGGNMTLGYALVAFPKEYGVTGKKVFIISNNGTVFERDFGDKETTEKYIKDCDEFNPTKDWAAAE